MLTFCYNSAAFRKNSVNLSVSKSMKEVTMDHQIQPKDSMRVPEPTLRRLPWYLSNVKLLKQKGERYVSSTQISRETNIDASQIAKDLSYVDISGRTRVGYEVDTLITVLEQFLGFTDIHKAFLLESVVLGGLCCRILV